MQIETKRKQEWRLKDIESFKELRIILVKGFIVELMIAARPPYPLSFRHLGGY